MEFTLDLFPDPDIEPLYLPEIKEEKEEKYPPVKVMSSILQVEITVQQLRERVKQLEFLEERRKLFPLPLIWLKPFGQFIFMSAIPEKYGITEDNWQDYLLVEFYVPQLDMARQANWKNPARCRINTSGYGPRYYCYYNIFFNEEIKYYRVPTNAKELISFYDQFLWDRNPLIKINPVIGGPLAKVREWCRKNQDKVPWW